MKLNLLYKKVLKDIKEDPAKKYLLFLLESENEPINTKTKLMKELFFVAQNVPSLKEKSDFEADNYGPNSDYISNVLDELIMLDLINLKGKQYTITPKGQELLEKVDEISEKELSMLRYMKRLFSGINTDETLALVYYTYPETTVESLVKDKIENKREKLALSLLKKGKISNSKAAEMSGIPLRKFYEILREKNIPIRLEV
jgi:predicted HTH domain antitoxin